jgi:ribosomal-protein-alanine N-acetyltransferase
VIATISLLNDAEALDIAGWRYKPPYDFYDADADPEDLAVLLDRDRRGDLYWSARDDSGALMGFFYFVPGGEEVEVGLGLRPDLTGRGLGLLFLAAGLDFARTRWSIERFRLYVAAFNERAIAVYERAGFRSVGTQERDLAVGKYEFVEMEREA